MWLFRVTHIIFMFLRFINFIVNWFLYDFCNFHRFYFLDALAYLDLMIETHSLTHSLTRRLEVDSPIPPQFSSLRLRHQPVTQNGMSLKWNVTQDGMSLKMECHSKWSVTQNEMSLKTECHSKWNVTKNAMSQKINCHSE